MAQSDIEIAGLAKVGETDAKYLVSLIRSIPGFPKEGIIFRDFMPVLADARAFGILMNALEAALPVDAGSFDLVAGLEARGFPLLQHAWARDSSPYARPASSLRKP